ncbi:NAD(P)-binding protein, partial [Aureobasidium melanogenum]
IQQMVDAIDYPMDGLRRIMEVNVAGSFLISKYTARLLRDQKLGGSIVLIASMSGQIANRGLHCSAYNTSKAAVHQMGRSLAYEWGQWGIRVNTLSPGYIRTAMTDGLLQEKPEVEESWMRGALLGRLGAPEDFKAPCVFLLADGSSWMTGADLRVDGGHCATA